MPYNPLALIFDGVVIRPLEMVYEKYLRLRIGPRNCEDLDAEIERDSLRWTQINFKIIYDKDLTDADVDLLVAELNAIENKDYYEKYLKLKRQ